MSPKLQIDIHSKSAHELRDNKLREKVEEIMKKAEGLRKEIEDLKNMI